MRRPEETLSTPEQAEKIRIPGPAQVRTCRQNLERTAEAAKEAAPGNP